MSSVLVTGSSGLIGSEVCHYFSTELGYKVHGVDNNQRAVFFGPQGDTRWNQRRLQRELNGFEHHELDIRDRAGVRALFEQLKPAAIVHAAARPSRSQHHSRPKLIAEFPSDAVFRQVVADNPDERENRNGKDRDEWSAERLARRSRPGPGR